MIIVRKAYTMGDAEYLLSIAGYIKAGTKEVAVDAERLVQIAHGISEELRNAEEMRLAARGWITEAETMRNAAADLSADVTRLTQERDDLKAQYDSLNEHNAEMVTALQNPEFQGWLRDWFGESFANLPERDLRNMRTAWSAGRHSMDAYAEQLKQERDDYKADYFRVHKDSVDRYEALAVIAARKPYAANGGVACASCGTYWHPDPAVFKFAEEHHHDTCAYAIAVAALSKNTTNPDPPARNGALSDDGLIPAAPLTQAAGPGPSPLGVGSAGLVLVCPDRDGQCPTPRDCGERGCTYTGEPV